MTTITIERTILDRLIEAWDSTVLPTHRDGMMQERMEDLRAALAEPEQEETFIPNWANYRQGVADGNAGSPKWHDAPTCDGLWVCNEGDDNPYRWTTHSVKFPISPLLVGEDEKWFGPIPQDGAKAEGGAA